MSEHDTTATLAEQQDDFCLSHAEAREQLAGAHWTRFGVLGDSLAEGLGEDLDGYRSLPWADRVREVLAEEQAGLEYLNIGYRGLLAAQVRDGQLERMLAFRPDLVALTAGGNDLFTMGFDPTAIEACVEDMVAQLRAGGADVITYGLMDLGAAFSQLASLRPRMRALNERMRALSERHDAIYVDMWEHPVCGELSAYSADMKHTSMRGHAVLAAETIKALGARLRRAA
ncbi:MAG TPA: SGNH/GDSL hydrolase family protein [Jatrophihabitans sp.]|nr:SGNH/GDSL hydrolase family protein [Jatrophihabitans sp.]